MNTTREQAFYNWMIAVDGHIARRMGGLNSNDLPDCCYRDWFDDGVSSERAASRAIRNAKEG